MQKLLYDVICSDQALRYKDHWYSVVVVCWCFTGNNSRLWWFNKCDIMERDVGARILINNFVGLQYLTVDVYLPGVGRPSTNFFDGGISKAC